MHRTELEESVRCVVCGTLTFGERDRAYVFGEDDAVCFDCAGQLGGEYDAAQERWTTPPELPENVPPPPA
jgi:hypothetical protein